MAWNPTAPAEIRTIPLESSRDPETGEAQASITVRKWRTGERLAYQDISASEAVVYEFDEDGKPTVKKMLPGVISRAQVSLSVIATEGFPPGFDAHDPEALDSLDGDVFDEILGHCLDMNPIRGAVRKPRDRKAKAEAGEGGEDPSRTPQTPAVE